LRPSSKELAGISGKWRTCRGGEDRYRYVSQFSVTDEVAKRAYSKFSTITKGENNGKRKRISRDCVVEFGENRACQV
jgi:hypothetical protein